MSEPIKSKRHEVTAPTPQNTPLPNAPISSHAQEPGMTSIREEDMDRAAALLSKDPLMVQMIQGRLGSLVGRPSGYIESLPKPVRRRVAGLKSLQAEYAAIEAELRAEFLEIEKKFHAKFKPIYEKRSAIVNGKSEPTDEEVQKGDEEYSRSIRESGEAGEPSESNDAAHGVTGIPEFWLSAMKNQISLAEIVTDRDEAALKHLTDIRMEYLDRPGFCIIFEFSPNEFFSDRTLKKTYFYQPEAGYGGDYIYDHAEGDTIHWAPGKDLTVRVEAKKQRNKSTKQTRIVKKTVPTESFFNFFSPPKPPADDEADDDDAGSDIEERLELDYQLAEDIKEKLIPRAIDWFTGEALAFEELDEDDIEHGEFDDDDEDDDEDDMSEDHDEDDESDDEDESGKPKQEAAECKQS